ncbi:MAG: hypothetical protein AB8B48_08695 [Pseudomonadales bacterium]
MNETPIIAASSIARIRSRWLGGLRCRSRVERDADDGRQTSIVLETDAARFADIRGSDTSASSVEHLLHALTSSVMATMVQRAQLEGIAIELVTSSSIGVRPKPMSADSQPQPLQAIDLKFEVKASERASEIEQLCANDPMYKTLRRALPVTISVIQAA